MRADRLLSLLLLIQRKDGLTTQALAQELEVSERTIFRDLEALSRAGAPVYASRGPGGGSRPAGRVTGTTRRCSWYGLGCTGG